MNRFFDIFYIAPSQNLTVSLLLDEEIQDMKRVEEQMKIINIDLKLHKNRLAHRTEVIQGITFIFNQFFYCIY